METDAIGDYIFAMLVEDVSAIRYLERTIGLEPILENITTIPVSIAEDRYRLLAAVEFRHLIDASVLIENGNNKSAFILLSLIWFVSTILEPYVGILKILIILHKFRVKN